MSKLATAIKRRELATVDDFASAIAQRWQDSVVAIIDVGKLMLRAKATLSHGGFGPMVKSKMVPFGWRTANRLMAIAEHSILANATHGSHLPPCWRTLYELAAVPAPIIEKWIAEEKICSELSRIGARKLVNDYRLSQRSKTDPKGLSYRWLLCLQMGQKKSPIWARRMSNWWKPVALFSKGDYSGKLVSDLIQDGKALSSEERFGLHEWAQTETSMAAVIEKFTSPGETVLDPFLGSGTTGVAALRLGRRFIGSDIDLEAVQVAAARLQSTVDNCADKPVSGPSSRESGPGNTRPGRRVLELSREVA